MSYDAAGNQTHDSYTGKGNRTYDAEHRQTSAVSDIYGNQSFYTYDASGKRVRRGTLTGQVWHIYGLDGELLAEYAANAAPAQPQKEYGYRNGELLVTAESGGQVNWLVADHLGTPRMIADLSGSLQGIRRHDYLPFGEEVEVFTIQLNGTGKFNVTDSRPQDREGTADLRARPVAGRPSRRRHTPLENHPRQRHLGHSRARLL